MRMQRQVRLWIVALVVAACGGGSPTHGTEEPSDAGADTTFDDHGLSHLDEVRTVIRTAICARLVRCNQVEDMATCLARELYVDTGFTLSQRAAIAAGNIRYDATLAEQCAGEVALLACDAPFIRYVVQGPGGIAEFCKAAGLTGMQGVGERCAGTTDECRNQACQARCDPGMCCASVCDDVPEPTPSSDRVPRHDRPAGAVCSGDSDCTLGLYCYYATKVCTQFPSLDQPCTGECGDGLRCDPMTLRCAKRGMAGASCASDDDCSSMYPFCDKTHHCTGGHHLGEDCNELPLCADDGTFCDVLAPDAPTCVRPKPDGAACLGGRECASGVCDDLTSHCVPEPVCF
jgi:hypothetical protein